MSNCFNVHFETACRDSALVDFFEKMLSTTNINDFYVRRGTETSAMNYIVEFESGGMPDSVCDWMEVHAIPETIDIVSTLGGIQPENAID